MFIARIMHAGHFVGKSSREVRRGSADYGQTGPDHLMQVGERAYQLSRN